MASLSSLPTELRQQILDYATELTMPTTGLLEIMLQSDGFDTDSSSTRSSNAEIPYGMAYRQNCTATGTMAALLSTNHLFREEMLRTVNVRVAELKEQNTILKPFNIRATGFDSTYLLSKWVDEWVGKDIRFLILHQADTHSQQMGAKRLVDEFPPYKEWLERVCEGVRALAVCMNG